MFRCSLRGLGALLSFLLPVALSTVRGEENLTIESIQKVWQQRTGHIHSVSAEWSCNRYVPAGGFSDIQAARNQRSRLEAKINKKEPPTLETYVPSKDYQTTTASSLRLAPGKIRYEYLAPGWSEKDKSVKCFQYVCVFSNGSARSLHLDGSSLTNYPDALVRPADNHPDMFDGALRPLTLTLFPNETKRQPYLITAFAVVRQFNMNGSATVEIARDAGKGAREIIWLDEGRGLVPVKLLHTLNGQSRFEAVVAHAPHPACGWAPQTWTLKEFQRDGSLLQSSTCTVNSIQVNESIPESAFELAFPSGTVVSESKGGKPAFSLITEDGNARPLSLEDMDKPYEELVQDRRSSRLTTMLGLAGLSLALLLLLAFFWHRKRSTRDS